MNVCVIGRGKVGRALHAELVRASVPCTLCSGRWRKQPPTGHDTYLVAVPDGRIHEVAERLSQHVDKRASVLHCAGARGLVELAPLTRRGVAVAVFHPLVSFASAKAPPALQGATFTSYGDRRATSAAKRIARTLGARCVVLGGLSAEHAAAYHAAASLVANGAAALTDQGVQIFLSLGYPRRAAERALGALLSSVATNVLSLGVPDALTGPVVRGDVQTVERHLSALGRVGHARRAAYAAVQPVVVASARDRGLDEAAARAIVRAARKVK